MEGENTVIGQEAIDLVLALNRFIINPIILLLFVIAAIVFFYGMVRFIGSAANEEGRAIGRRHMLYGLLGLFVMFTAFGIIRLILATLGIPEPSILFF